MATQKKKKKNPFYEGIMAGLRNAIDYEKGLPVDAVISIRDVDLPEPPDPMTARRPCHPPSAIKNPRLREETGILAPDAEQRHPR
ncbi:MAG TPA: hypothetical protein VM008_10745 [Phycisphaerae bacterium]|nr:hypothetical protein [Phycisphaerae bacterium]